MIIIVALSIPAATAVGQFRLVHRPGVMRTGQSANLFLRYDADTPASGVYIAIPAAWKLLSVRHVSSSGQASVVPVSPTESFQNRYLLRTRRTIRQGDELILGVRTGSDPGDSMIRITPVDYFPGPGENRPRLIDRLSTQEPFQVDSERPSESNHALRIEMPETDAPPLRVEKLPRSAFTDSYTVEFWVKTVSFPGILLSTWNGDENTSYPIELLLDERGSLVFFKGQPGAHRSMRSETRVADGAWHHIAVTYDREKSWRWLFVDGQAADSLYSIEEPAQPESRDLVLAGRPGGASDAVNAADFVSEYDELRIWPIARDRTSIRRMLRQTMEPQSDRVFVESFEELDGTGITSSWPDGSATVVPSDLSFYESIRNLHVVANSSGVLLEWEAPDRNAVKFVVERSPDGRIFEEIGVVERTIRLEVPEPSVSLAFHDLNYASRVMYYRIRQIFSDNTERTSQSVKIGIGEDEKDALAVLNGNFPNPFNPETTITYTLRERQHVRISVWDLSGQLIAQLVNETQDSGEHTIRFDAGDLPSGTYFVRMNTPDGIRSHQMILMK